MMETRSPALLVWTITTRLAAPRGNVHARIAARAARDRRRACVFAIVINSLQRLFAAVRRLPDHPGSQGLPLRVVLRAPVLASTVKEIATSLLGERVEEESALQAAGHHHSPDRLEVLGRLLLGPGRRSRV